LKGRFMAWLVNRIMNTDSTDMNLENEFLLDTSGFAYESLCEKLSEGDLVALEPMMSKPLYTYFKTTLEHYKKTGTKFNFPSAKVRAGRIVSKEFFLRLRFGDAKHLKAVNLLAPNMYTALKESESLLVMVPMFSNFCLVAQLPKSADTSGLAVLDLHQEMKQVMRAGMNVPEDDVQVCVKMRVYFEAQEIYSVKDKDSTLLEGSDKETTNFHLWDFVTTIPFFNGAVKPRWHVNDMFDFNVTSGDKSFFHQSENNDGPVIFRESGKNLKDIRINFKGAFGDEK